MKFQPPVIPPPPQPAGLSDVKYSASLGISPATLRNYRRTGWPQVMSRLGWLVYWQYLKDDPGSGWVRAAMLSKPGDLCLFDERWEEAIQKSFQETMAWPGKTKKLFGRQSHLKRPVINQMPIKLPAL